MITALIITRKRPDSLNMVLANIKHLNLVTKIVVMVQDIDESINYTTTQLLQAYQQEPLRVPLEIIESEDVIDAQLRYPQHAENELTLWIDDDVILNPYYMLLHRHFFNDPKVGAVSGAIITPTDEGYEDWSSAYIRIPARRKGATIANSFEVSDGELRWNNKYQVYKIGNSRPLDARLLIGGAMLLRTEFFHQADKFFGGFTDGVPNFLMHEFDLTMTISRMGYRLIYDPIRTAWHLRYRDGRKPIPDEMVVRNWNHILAKDGLEPIKTPPVTFHE